MSKIYESLYKYIKKGITITDCVFRKLFAFFANRLRFSQKSIHMPKNKDISITTSFPAFYVENRKKWAWQIGNDQYCERHFSFSQHLAQTESREIAKQYAQFDKQFHSSDIRAHIQWQRDNKNGFIGRYKGFEFWISPIHQVKSGLWRYDIYHASDSKSICYGVAQSMLSAQFACIRFAATTKL